MAGELWFALPQCASLVVWHRDAHEAVGMFSCGAQSLLHTSDTMFFPIHVPVVTARGV